jgi:hypothetical protein
MEKTCKKCEETKEISDFSEGRNQCKNCMCIAKANYYRKNAETIKKRVREWEANNPEISREGKLKWKRNNTERRKESGRRWAQANPEKITAIKMKYSKTLKGRESGNRKVRKRRAVQAEALHHGHSFAIESVFEKMRQRLTKCLGINFDLDHIFPISQGGPHHHGNLQVVPRVLNIKKGNKLNYTHPVLTHWTELPESLINWKTGP